jgi:hypothetical protein
MKYFKNFSDLRSNFLDVNSRCPWYLKFDANRAASVSWLNSKKSATYLTESIFTDVFNYEAEVLDLMTQAGDPKQKSDKNRIETINLLSSSNKLRLDKALTSVVLGEMSDLLLLSGSKYKTVGPSLAFDSLPQSTSSSFPDFLRPKTKVKEKVVSCIHNLLRSKVRFPFVLFPISINWRTQISSSGKLKFRQFYPFPVLIAVIEKMIFNGIFVHFENNKTTPYCMGNTYTDLAVRYSYWQNRNYIYSLDFEAFDQRLENDLIKLCIDFLSSKIQLSYYDKFLVNDILDYHRNCLIISCVNGLVCMFKKKRGLMSGSSLTNLVGSLINIFCILYLNRKYRLQIDTKSLSVLGDDIIFASNIKLELSDLSKLYNDEFYMKVSIEKSQIFLPSQKVFFLGHYFDMKGRYLDEHRVKLQLCISENFIHEEVLSTNDRIWSKFCSICFKCSDGSEFFNKYHRSLMYKLRLEKPLGYYYTLFNSDGDMYKKLKFEEFKLEGWRSQ